MRKHIGVLTSDYTPRRSASSKALQNLCRELAKTNNVTVFHTQSDTLSSPGTLDGYELRRISDVGVDLRARYEGAARQGSRFASNLLLMASRVWTHVNKRLSGTNVNKPLARSFFRAIRTEQLDAIIAICYPFEGLMAAARYARSHPETKFIAWIGDMFANREFDLASGATSARRNERMVKLEAGVLRQASHVFYTNEMAPYIASRYPDVLERAEPLPFFPVMEELKSDLPPIMEPGSLAYFGSLGGDKDPRYALELIGACVDSGTLTGVASQFRVDIFTQVNATSRSLVGSCSSGAHVHLHDFEPVERVKRLMLDASWLLVIGSLQRQIPSIKVDEYIATGKPILYVAQIEEDPNLYKLDNYPLALVVRRGDGFSSNVEQVSAFLVESMDKRVPFADIAERYPLGLPDTASKLFESQM